VRELNFALVNWEDASENDNREDDMVPIAVPVLVTFSFGYIVAEDSQSITLSRDYFPAPSPKHEDSVRKKLTIPKSNIKNIVKFKVGRNPA